MADEIQVPQCSRCRKPILDPMYVLVSPALLLQRFFAQTPPIFKCKEHAENYMMQMIFHDDCWMEELRDHGVPIHDMKEVTKRYAREELERLISSSSSSSYSSSSSSSSYSICKEE